MLKYFYYVYVVSSRDIIGPKNGMTRHTTYDIRHTTYYVVSRHIYHVVQTMIIYKINGKRSIFRCSYIQKFIIIRNITIIIKYIVVRILQNYTNFNISRNFDQIYTPSNFSQTANLHIYIYIIVNKNYSRCKRRVYIILNKRQHFPKYFNNIWINKELFKLQFIVMDYYIPK